MPDISQITLPSGNTYDIKDTVARQMAAAGVTFTVSTNAATTPYGVTWDNDGQVVTGTLAASSSTTGVFYLVPATTSSGKDIYAEYVTVEISSVYSWEKVGTTDIDLSDLGALAYKSSASASYTPAGSVSVQGGIGSKYTPAGTIAVNASSGTGTSYTPTGSISIGSSGTAYTPAGSVSAPTITKSEAGTTKSITPFGTAGTLPELTMTVSNEILSISFSQGTLPTAGTSVTVKTGDAKYTASQPSFTGTATNFAFTGEQKKLAFTGTETQLLFTGTAATITVT